MAIPSKCERNPSPRAEVKEPRAGKQAVQLKAASQTPPEPTLSRVLLIIDLYLNFLGMINPVPKYGVNNYLSEFIIGQEAGSLLSLQESVIS